MPHPIWENSLSPLKHHCRGMMFGRKRWRTQVCIFISREDNKIKTTQNTISSVQLIYMGPIDFTFIGKFL